MKKFVLLMICVCLITAMPASVMASVQPDDYDEDGTPIYYIDVSPEEWEETFLDHPYFQKYDPQKKAIFRLRDNNQIKAICYKCGKNSASLKQEWRDVKIDQVICPGNWFGSDKRNAWTWVYGDYCNSCGLLGKWYYDEDRYKWSWFMDCHDQEDSHYPIYLYKSLNDGYAIHNVYSIKEGSSGIVHGLNCDCKTNKHDDNKV